MLGFVPHPNLPVIRVASIPAITSQPIIEDHYSVTEKIFDKTIKKFLTCHFERSEKSSASKILRMHKISPSGRDDIFFIYVMKFWFRLGRVRESTVYIETPIPSFYHEIREGAEFVAMKNWSRKWWDFRKGLFKCFTSVAVLDELEEGNHPRENYRGIYVSEK